VWSRRPDLIAFANAAGKRDPMFVSGHELFAMPEFHRVYQWIRIEGTVGNRSHGEVWLRREGGKVGIVRTPERISVPGYFFTGENTGAGASIDARGKLIAYVSEDKPGDIVPFVIGPGRFRMRITPAAGPLSVSLHCGPLAMSRTGDGISPVLEFRQPALLGVVIAPRRGTAAIESVEFEPVTAAPTFRCTSGGERLVVGAADVSIGKREGDAWASAGSVVFGLQGLSVKLDHVTRTKSIELTVDNNDTYILQALLRGKPVALTRTISAQTNTRGLAIHTLSLASDDAPDGFDEIWMTPRAGDGHYSLGHLSLVP